MREVSRGGLWPPAGQQRAADRRSFGYVPPGVRCPMELSTYFRINAAESGQFERTLIIADREAPELLVSETGFQELARSAASFQSEC